MKLVTWNCNGAFRKKYEELDSKYNADIYLIQECENPSKYTDSEYYKWASNCIWDGINENKGIAVFAKSHVSLKRLSWPDNGFSQFLPVEIDDSFNLINVWTKGKSNLKYRYIGQLWNYIKINKHRLKNSIIAGDFNSNSIWDSSHDYWSHSQVTSELESLGYNSLYHYLSNEPSGSETKPTFFLHRHIDKAYHIDYVFAQKEFINSAKFEIGDSEEWLKSSDHLPIEFSLQVQRKKSQKLMEDSFSKLSKKVLSFTKDREWQQFHNPKDLATALAIEIGELQELYLWKNENAIYDVNKSRIKEEVADILMYTMLLMEHYQFDLTELVENKLRLNSEKYPIEKARGNSNKYNQL